MINDSSLLKSILKESLVRPEENGMGEIVPLSETEKQILNKLWSNLVVFEENQKLKIVFRGDKKARLEKKLFQESEELEPGKIFDRLFYFGEKSKHYFKYNVLAEREQKAINSQKERSYLLDINDDSDYTFDFIFKKIQEIFSSNNIQSSNIRNAVKEFKENNEKFYSFFCTESNKNLFMEMIKKITCSQAKQRAKDYYLYLLHTFGKKSFSPLSFFVSTSENKEQAEKFAKSKKEDGRITQEIKSIILVYMVLEPFHKYAMNLSLAHKFKKDYESTSLPFYKTDFYPEQKELSIKGALFPQYILGLYDLEHNYFVVNPHIFKQPKDILSQVPSKGLIINQTDLKKMIQETGYKRYVRCIQGIYLDA